MALHLNISPFHGQDHARLRLEDPHSGRGLDVETFRGFQLAGALFLLTSFFIEPNVRRSAETLRKSL
jgi:hypothetical protein